jgi:hypothetical protein
LNQSTLPHAISIPFRCRQALAAYRCPLLGLIGTPERLRLCYCMVDELLWMMGEKCCAADLPR